VRQFERQSEQENETRGSTPGDLAEIEDLRQRDTQACSANQIIRRGTLIRVTIKLVRHPMF
jgi:hypothetical protein